jgi:5-methylcytosine-specific restriction endonuclease McrA
LKHTNGRLNAKVLVLNQNYEALTICSTKKAVVLLLTNKAEIIAKKDGLVLRSPSTTLPFPSIIRLSNYVNVHYKMVLLSRKNILRRDNHKCQYCGRSDLPLTIDHVIPKSKGGQDTWENLVTACIKCNNKKGDRTLEEANMHLIRKPFRPSHIMFLKNFVGQVDERWKPFLYLT